MTSLSETCSARLEISDGQTVFDSAFICRAASDLVVQLEDEDGAIATPTGGTYSRAFISGGGGTVRVTFSPSPSSIATHVLLRRETSALQQARLRDLTNNPAGVSEGALDLLTFLAAEAKETLARTLRAPTGETLGFIPSIEPRKGTTDQGSLLGFAHDDGEPVIIDVAEFIQDVADIVLIQINIAIGFLTTPMLHGATGNGDDEDPADDTLAVIAALAQAASDGRTFDGANRCYAVSGTITVPSGVKKLQNFKLRQLAAAADTITLHFDTLSGFDLQNAEIDLNENRTLGTANTSLAFLFEDCTKCKTADLKVSRGGPQTAIAFRGGSDYRAFGLTVEDMKFELAAATDDKIQGVQFQNGTRFAAGGIHLYNFRGEILGVATRRFNRGLVLNGNSQFSIDGVTGELLGQGIDFSGTVGNSGWSLSNWNIVDAYTYGLKIANSGEFCSITNGYAERCGIAGVFASAGGGYNPPPGGGSPIMPNTMVFANIVVVNPGGFVASGTPLEDIDELEENGIAFRFEAGKENKAHHPSNITLSTCKAIDNRADGDRLMTVGFYTSRRPLERDTRAGLERLWHQVIKLDDSCSSTGHTEAESRGFYRDHCSLTGSASTGNIASGTSVNTLLEFDTTIVDDGNMHSSDAIIEAEADGRTVCAYSFIHNDADDVVVHKNTGGGYVPLAGDGVDFTVSEPAFGTSIDDTPVWNGGFITLTVPLLEGELIKISRDPAADVGGYLQGWVFPKELGTYMVGFTVPWAASAAGVRQVRPVVRAANGLSSSIDTRRDHTIDAAASGITKQTGTFVGVRITELGEAIGLMVNHTKGSDTTIDMATASFSVQRTGGLNV